MSWMRLEASFREHPKTRRLARMLGISAVQTRGHLITLWSWALINAPDGNLTSCDVEDIEAVAEWEGTRGLFVSALLELKLLDRLGDQITIHDWMEYAGAYKAAQKKSQQRNRRVSELLSRDSPGTVQGQSPEQEGQSPKCPRGQDGRDRTDETRQDGRDETDEQISSSEDGTLTPAGSGGAGPNGVYHTTEFSPRARTVDIDAVIERYRSHHPRSKPGPHERALIAKRLHEGYNVGDLCKAIDGCHISPYHCGENERGVAYQSLELIVRDSKHVADFIEIHEKGPQPTMPESSRRNARTVNEWLLKHKRVAERRGDLGNA